MGAHLDLSPFACLTHAGEPFATEGQGDVPGRLGAYFPAQEGQGTTLSDAGGRGLQARLLGGTWDQSELPALPFWGIARAEGLYREVIRGLRPTPIVLKGTFQLERLNRDPSLN